jgi:hypothetical protein
MEFEKNAVCHYAREFAIDVYSQQLMCMFPCGDILELSTPELKAAVSMEPLLPQDMKYRTGRFCKLAETKSQMADRKQTLKDDTVSAHWINIRNKSINFILFKPCTTDVDSSGEHTLRHRG